MAVIRKEAEYLMKQRETRLTDKEQYNKGTHTETQTLLTDTDELGALVQYPDEGTDATDHLRPSTLQR